MLRKLRLIQKNGFAIKKRLRPVHVINRLGNILHG